MDYLDFPNNKPSRHLRQKHRDKRLAEELIECRRYCGGDTNKKTREKGATKRKQNNERLGYHPRHEPICIQRRAHFTDNLEPLERFLRSHVGRPWSVVYSELKGQLDGGSVTGQHVIQHLQDYMGRGCCYRGEVQQYRSRNDGVSLRFAIHPDTGLLCIADLRTALPEGPFPQKARFKKEKERRKSRLRLGLEEKTRPQKQQPEARDWLRRLLRERGSERCGLHWEDLLRRAVEFCEPDWDISLRLHEAVRTTAKLNIHPHSVGRLAPVVQFRGVMHWRSGTGEKRPKRLWFRCLWYALGGEFVAFEVI